MQGFITCDLYPTIGSQGAVVESASHHIYKPQGNVNEHIQMDQLGQKFKANFLPLPKL